MEWSLPNGSTVTPSAIQRAGQSMRQTSLPPPAIGIVPGFWLLNLLTGEQIEALRAVLRGATSVAVLEEAFEVSRSLAHGHVAAVVGTMHKLGLPEILSTRKHPKRQRALAMIAARILDPCSKLATAQRLDSGTLSSSLGEVLGEVTHEGETLLVAAAGPT